METRRINILNCDILSKQKTKWRGLFYFILEATTPDAYRLNVGDSVYELNNDNLDNHWRVTRKGYNIIELRNKVALKKHPIVPGITLGAYSSSYLTQYINN
jgi:hypothetical protein